ncbi:MAG: prepilin-type N-terminal cleavage/methylation domain-containing protein [Clostridia bacterium]|nr:prepilin-type N-terminal cleavage/methylation domain-containing protein [Clostridia bacterium]
MNKLMNLKQDKKGFTLIEIVIVLVIIAILSAALIPSMMGWIDDSKKKSFLTEARSAMVVAQAEIGNMYAAGGTVPDETFTEAANWENIAKKTNATYTSKNLKWTLDDNKQFKTFHFDNGTYKVDWAKATAWGEVTKGEAPKPTTTAAPAEG